MAAVKKFYLYPMEKPNLPSIENMWMECHPYYPLNNTDRYFIAQAIKLKKIISAKHGKSLKQLNPELFDGHLAVFIMAWFEEVTSGVGIWKAITDENMRRYNKHVLFYPSENYYPGEINVQDVRFLCWYWLNMSAIHLNGPDPEMKLSPWLDLINHLAEDIFAFLDDMYETAPENEELIRSVKPVNGHTFRNIGDFMEKIENFGQMYLFIFERYINSRLLDLTINLDEDSDIDPENPFEENQLLFSLLFFLPTRFFAYTINKLYAGALGNDHPEAEHIFNIQTAVGNVIYKGNGSKNRNTFKLETIDDQQTIEVEKSILSYISAYPGDEVTVQLINWRNKWYSLSDIPSSVDLNQIYKDSNLFTDDYDKKFLEQNKNERLNFIEYFGGEAMYFADIREAIIQLKKFYHEKLKEPVSTDELFIPDHLLDNVQDHLKDDIDYGFDLKDFLDDDGDDDKIAGDAGGDNGGSDNGGDLDGGDPDDKVMVMCTDDGLCYMTGVVESVPDPRNQFYTGIKEYHPYLLLVTNNPQEIIKYIFNFPEFRSSLTFPGQSHHPLDDDELDFCINFFNPE